MRSRASARRVAFEAALVALAVTLGLVETLIVPPLPVPGLRLGLANLAVLLALRTGGAGCAARVSLVRVALVGMAAGTILGPTGVLSLAGALASLVAMALVARLGRDRFSLIGWSLAGSAAHVVGQILAACMIAGTAAPALLAPVSLAVSLPTGLLIGYSARLLLSRIPSRTFSYA